MNWLFISFALITQEVVSLNTMIYEVHRLHFHVWLIHILFAVATLLDILIGYAIGRYSKKKVTNKKITSFAEKWSGRFHAFVGTKGRKLALFLLGNFSFPYINAFIAAWLDMPFWESIIILFLGNMVWYAATWLFVIGIAKAVPNPVEGLVVIIAATIAATLLIRKYRIGKV